MASRLSTNGKLLIVLVLLGGAAAVKAFVLKPTGDTGESAQASESLFPGLKKEELTALLIEAPENNRHQLVKDGDHWTVASEGNARADQTDVNKVLDAITKLKRGRVISTKGDNLDRYGLDAAKATKVTAWGKEGTSGKPVATFLVGKVPDDWRNAFLKLPDEAAVRKVEGAVDDYSPGVDNTWRDKTMYDHGAADKIARIEITGPKGALALEREKVMGPKTQEGDKPADPTDPKAADPDKPADPAAPKGESDKPGEEVKETVWNLVAPQQARAKKWLCDSIAGYVAKLDCDSFGTEADKLAEIGLDPPQYTIRVQREGESQPTDVLLVGNKNKDGKYAVKLPAKENAQVWWIASWKGDYLTKSVEDLLETPPPKPGETPDGKAAATPPEKQDENQDGKKDESKGDGAKGDASGDGAAAPKSGDAAPAPESKPAAPAGDGTKPDDGGKPKPNGQPDGAKPNGGGA